MPIFRKRKSKPIRLYCSSDTYARVLLVKAAQTLGENSSGLTVNLYLDEYLEQRIDSDFRAIYGMTFDEFRRQNPTLPRIFVKPTHARQLAAIALEVDGDELPDEGTIARRGIDVLSADR